MAIEPNRHFPSQMNGPVISAYGNAVDQEFSAGEAVISYLKNLSIDTAQETELENIGRLIGYIRPLVPEGFNAENILLLGDLPIASDPDIGLAAINSQLGGQLSTILETETGFMSHGVYRKFLKSMAILKRYGVTLYSVDQVVKNVSTDFTLMHDENGDIIVNFEEDIGYKNIWILSQLFYRIATTPQIYISSGQFTNLRW